MLLPPALTKGMSDCLFAESNVHFLVFFLLYFSAPFYVIEHVYVLKQFFSPACWTLHPCGFLSRFQSCSFFSFFFFLVVAFFLYPYSSCCSLELGARLSFHSALFLHMVFLALKALNITCILPTTPKFISPGCITFLN